MNKIKRIIMDDDIGIILMLAVIVTFVAFVLGDARGNARGIEMVNNKAIEQGIAEYHSTTGEWQWKEGQ